MSRSRLNDVASKGKEGATASAPSASLRIAFGRRLRALRHHRLMSQRVLATTSHVSMNTIGSIERGLRFPSPEVLESLATALEVEVKEMFEVEDQASPVTLEGSARELCRVVNNDLLPRVEHLTQLAQRLLAAVEGKKADDSSPANGADDKRYPVNAA